MRLKLIKQLCLATTMSLVFTHVYAADNSATIPQSSTPSISQTDFNKKQGDSFFQSNRSKKGVVSLSDGLQYKVIKAGNGTKPTEEDIVTVEYSGRFLNGQEFDNSDKHGGAVSFPLNQVIPGWVEALKLMPTGSTWEIYVPSNLAYGEQGAPPTIGPNQALIFTVTLNEIKKKA